MTRVFVFKYRTGIYFKGFSSISLYSGSHRHSPISHEPIALHPHAVIYFPNRPLPNSTQRYGQDPIGGRGIRNALVLAAMRKVPRHQLVPGNVRHLAYEDGPLPIGNGQTISQPYIVAFMTEAIDPKPGMKVLEIGTGSGYQAAVLGEIVGEVYTIEIVEPLGKKAQRDLADLGYKNVHVRVGDGYQGWPEEAPFDAIIVTAAPDKVPQPLIDQLKEAEK
jgi:protein-L-isoaspartate(D-aspartate) O-methyltransferase